MFEDKKNPLLIRQRAQNLSLAGKKQIEQNKQSRPESISHFTKCPISDGIYTCKICTQLKKLCPYRSKQNQPHLCNHSFRIKQNYIPTTTQNTNPHIYINNHIKIPQVQSQQIIYYPVIHNRLVFYNPNPESVRSQNYQASAKKKMANSFLASTLPHEPITPEQLKNMTSSFLN